MQRQIILVDFENVQPSALGSFQGGGVQIKVFVGAHQKSIPLELARQLHVLGPDAEYVRMQGSGRNALDFHIAYYLGCLSTEFPQATFFIVSKDTGFDPLVAHLKERSIICRRVPMLAEALGSPLAARRERNSREQMKENLAKLGVSRPRTVKTLSRWMKALLGGQASAEEVTGLVQELQAEGVLQILDGKVSYPKF